MGHSCCYRSEYEAFGDALWPRTNATARDEVAILTDSPTLVWRMEKGTVQQERKDCSVIYIPGYCCIQFNESADKLAREADTFFCY